MRFRIHKLATKKNSGEKPVAQDYQKLKMGRTRDEMCSFVHYRLIGRRMDGQMGGQMDGPKVSLRMAFDTETEDLNASAQLSPPYAPHPARPNSADSMAKESMNYE